MKPLLCELSVHLRDEFRARLLRTCVTLIDRLNPDVDILLIDNASPMDPLGWLPVKPASPWSDMGVCLATDGPIPAMPSGRAIARFPDAIGHPHLEKDRDPPAQDGPGRSNMTSLLIAYASGYERSVYQETDCLFVRPYEEGFAQLTKKVGCQERTIHGHYDWNIWYKADLPWLRDFQFVEKYAWPTRSGHEGPVGEAIYETILGEENLQALPTRGCRGDFTGTNADNLRERFPTGIEYLTHVDEATFVEFLAYTGHDDLIPMLQGKE